MWKKITDGLPPVGKEVLFITIKDKEKVIGEIAQYKNAQTGEPVYGFVMKEYSFMCSIMQHSHHELEIVSHWDYIPEDPPEEIIDRFELMEME